jgi:hypothetical protein
LPAANRKWLPPCRLVLTSVDSFINSSSKILKLVAPNDIH